MTKRGLSFGRDLSFSSLTLAIDEECGIQSVFGPGCSEGKKKKTHKDINVWRVVREELLPGKEDDNANDEFTEEMH